MNNVLSAHPGQERLAAFRVGKVSPEELTEIEHHLADCPSCCQSLKALPDDSLIDRLREAVSAATLQPEATPAESRDQAGGRTYDWALPAPAVAVPPELADHPRYQILGLLGRGGMGAVYKAEHQVMERTVALKVINRSLTDRPAMVERFHREVKAAARLSHPNIVTAHDTDQAGDTHFLVMEYVEGTTLALLAAARGPLPVAEACNYVRQTALGLQHAFEHGMVHRDIKPQYLMVTPEGRVKVLDFGLARFASEVAPAGPVTESGTVLGTADYISPEQADAPHAADIRADLYSLGCTLYFLLTGQPPFPEGTLMQKLKAHEQRLPPPVTTFRKDIPPELARVLERLLAKKPADRYQTPAEAARALEPFAGADGASLVPGPQPARADAADTADFIPAAQLHWRRVRALVAVAVAVLLLGAVVAAVVVYRIATDKGEFVVEVDDPEVEVLLAKHGLTVKDRKAGREYHLKPGHHDLRTGEYEIKVTEVPDGLQFSTKQFTVTRGGKERVKVTRKPSAINVGEIRRFEGHLHGVVTVAISPDGRLALSGGGPWAGGDSILRLWDVRTGTQLRRLEGHTDGVVSVAFSPDGKQALSGGHSHDKTVRLWDIVTGKELKCFEGHKAAVSGVAFCPDGKRFVSSSGDATVRLWEIESGKELKRFQGHTAGVRGIALSPSGRQLLSGSYDSTVRLWDVETGKEMLRFEGHEGLVSSVAFSPSGRQAVSGGFDATVRLWDLETGKEIRRLKGHDKEVHAVAFSPDGRRLLSGSYDQTVRLWDVETGKELHRFFGHTSFVWSVVFSPDGRHALSGSHDKTLRLWRLPDPPPPEKVGEVRR
jgi:WD40 repeat protein